LIDLIYWLFLEKRGDSEKTLKKKAPDPIISKFSFIDFRSYFYSYWAFKNEKKER